MISGVRQNNCQVRLFPAQTLSSVLYLFFFGMVILYWVERSGSRLVERSETTRRGLALKREAEADSFIPSKKEIIKL